MFFFSEKLRLKKNLATGLMAGTISGFCAGLFNIGGPPMVAYFLGVAQDKNAYNATLQAFFCFNTVTVFAVHLCKGNVTPQMLPLMGFSLVGISLGTLCGLLLFKKLTIKGIRTFVYIFMTVAGIYSICCG